jgi:hypothetical protein
VRRLLRSLSPWHRGHAAGYAAALRDVQGGLEVSAALATAYGHQTLDDAARAVARALGGTR